MSRTLYKESVVQLKSDGLSVDWEAQTQVTLYEDGYVCIWQDGDEVWLPKAYVNDMIFALEEARNALERHRGS
jgi:hypothetical protein